MLGRLTKLASRSAQLRKIAMEKQAILGAIVSKVGGGAANLVAGKIARDPLGVAGKAVFGLAAGQAVAEKSKEFKAGFDPNSQKQMLGQAPTPPGVK